MNVSYQQGLEDVANMLGVMGYAMYPLKSGMAADAVLYTSDVRGMNAEQISEAIVRRGCERLF